VWIDEVGNYAGEQVMMEGREEKKRKKKERKHERQKT
jgi:hypothetical protein